MTPVRPSHPAGAMADLAVEVRGVSKTFSTSDGDVVALEDVSFEVGDREFIAIVGPSGCGKTTLLKMAAGLVPTSAGEVLVFGERVQGPVADVGMVFQGPVLLTWRTVLRNVLFPIEILRRDPRQYRDRALEILQLVGLEGFENRFPAQLSGGMQQRVSIARALIHNPRLMLMDEPFGALDQLTRDQMNLELLRIWREAAKTTILVTHSIEEAVFLADRVLVMTPRPGTVAKTVDVDLPRPRTRRVQFTPQFSSLVQQVGRLLGLEYD